MPGWSPVTDASWGEEGRDSSEVHRTVGQVVLAANIADLLGLHSFKLGAVSDPMAKASTEGTAPFSWEWREGLARSQDLDLDPRLTLLAWTGFLVPSPRLPSRTLETGAPALHLPPMSNMDSSPQCSTCKTGGTFCLASSNKALRSMSTDSSKEKG